MEHWQFLIQKQGDRGWNTLESLNLQILPGKYRVLARSWLLNTDVEVRVTHICTEEVPPKRRILKRSRKTNADGLMAVIPFTQFNPGIWELRCCADVMSEMLGKSWQHILRIEVLSERQPDPLIIDNDREESLENKVNIVMNPLVNPMWLRGETTEQILQNLLDIAIPSEEATIDEESLDDVLALPVPLLVNLTLDQDTYISKWGNNFTINGYVEINDMENLEDEKLKINQLSNLQLEIALITPLNSKVINHIKQSLSNKFLPFDFSFCIDIPEKCESKLLLGDIHLYGVYGEVGEVQLLGSHSFIVTADVSELLAVKNQNSHFPNSLEENNEDSQQKLFTPIGLELFNVAKTPNLVQFHILKPAVNTTLPPQIKPVSSGENFAPKLPSLPTNSLSKIVNDNSAKVVSLIPPINLEKLQIKSVKTSFPYLTKLSVKTKIAEVHKNEPLLPITTSKKEDLPQLLLVDSDGMDEYLQQAIANIQEEEIMDILNETDDPQLLSVMTLPKQDVVDSDGMDEYLQQAIANIQEEEIIDDVSEDINIISSEFVELNTIDTSENINEDVSSEPIIIELNDPKNDLSFSLLKQWKDQQEKSISPEINEEEINEKEIDTDEQIVDANENIQIEEIIQPVETSIPMREIVPNWLSQEVVIDDVVIETLAEEKDSNLVVEEKTDIVDFAMMESLPTPQLYLSEGELIAGTSLTVRVEIPKVLSDITVKLWIEDYQTRSLLDNPHIITDLHSTAWGTMEAVMSFMVPYGCLEMSLGAIAFHQITEQESNKVTMLKKIIPGDLPRDELYFETWH